MTDRIKRSPLCLQGSVHPLTSVSHSDIRVGCLTHPAEWWLKYYKNVGCAYGYTDEQIEEYGRHLQYMASEMRRRFGGAR